MALDRTRERILELSTRNCAVGRVTSEIYGSISAVGTYGQDLFTGLNIGGVTRTLFRTIGCRVVWAVRLPTITESEA